MGCRLDHLLPAIFEAVFREMKEEADLHHVTVAELEILIFRATPVEGTVIMIGLKDVGAEMMVIEGMKEMIGNGKGIEGAKRSER